MLNMHSSPPGLTRGPTFFCSLSEKRKLDCRVKPGKEEVPKHVLLLDSAALTLSEIRFHRRHPEALGRRPSLEGRRPGPCHPSRLPRIKSGVASQDDGTKSSIGSN